MRIKERFHAVSQTFVIPEKKRTQPLERRLLLQAKWFYRFLACVVSVSTM